MVDSSGLSGCSWLRFRIWVATSFASAAPSLGCGSKLGCRPISIKMSGEGKKLPAERGRRTSGLRLNNASVSIGKAY